jgi:hypothetical protein
MNMNKEICKWCCQVENTAAFRDDEQVGIICLWNMAGESDRYDDDLWDKNLIHCPHKRQPIDMDRVTANYCLRFDAQQEAGISILVPIDEIKL